MKSKIIIVMFSGLLACRLVASAQDNSPAAADAAAAALTKPAAQPAPDAPTAAADSAVASTNAPVQTPADTNSAPPAAESTAIQSSSDAPVSAPIIPLIVMDDVPLTDAIKNLARQANINYLLDPRIAFGQPGPDGKTVPQPTVSIRWENITAEQALTAMINNYGLQFVDDPKTKIARVTIKDPAAPELLVTRIIQLKFTSPSNILDSVKATLIDKRSKVMPDVRTSQLVVVATERELDAVDQLVARLDTPTKQVLIEANLVETDMNPKSIKGIDWSGTLQAQNLAVGNNLQLNSPATALNNTLAESTSKILLDTAKGFNPATAFLNADGVSAVLSFINNNSESKVLSTPRTVTLDNEPSRLSVTTEYPIITTSPSSANTPGATSLTYSNLGVILDVTPRISANNYINLKVIPEVSRIASSITVISGGFPNSAYIFSVQRMETTVMIPSGNTLVLGGLVQDDIEKQNTKVPLLGDIPGLGNLFRSDSKSRKKSNLLVFITPTIVCDGDYQLTKSDFLKTPLPHDSEPKWSAWDSGEPYDWSRIGK